MEGEKSKKAKKIPVEFLEEITKSIQLIKDDTNKKIVDLEKKIKDLEDNGVQKQYVLDPYYAGKSITAAFSSELRGNINPEESRRFLRDIDIICQRYKITSVSAKYINK